MVSQKFPPDLLYRVRESIDECGFCVFGMDDIARLLSEVRGGRAARRQALEEFAALSGTRMETTPNLNSARFMNPPTQSGGAAMVLQSPVFPDTAMHLSELEPGLFAYLCPKSGGVWIPFQSYLDWKEHHRHDTAALPAPCVPVPTDDSTHRALLCPESGRVLIRYRVGHGLKLHVDVSPDTGGIWLHRVTSA